MALRSISQLKSWFKKGMYPTESQFGDWLDSFFHREDKIPVGSVDGLSEAINSKAEQSAVDTLSQSVSAISTKADGASSAASSALGDAKQALLDAATAQATAQQAIADAAAAITALKDGVATEGDTLAKLYASIQTLKAIVASPDVNLDTVQEIVTFIKNNKDVIDSISTNKVNISDIVDNLLSTDINRPLSANQGKVLKDLLDALTTSLGNKVDKVIGKQLSTEDYTTEEKQKLAQQSGVNTGDQDLSGLQARSEKNQPNGFAGVDETGHIPAVLLPSYVDDVLEFANFAALPAVGESGKIYITTNDNKQYRWSGSVYVNIAASPGTTDSVTEGATNLYFTEGRVRNAVLTGISFLVNQAITATDSVLGALGKLQAQITALGNSKVDKNGTDTLMTAAERAKLTGIAEGANNYVHPTSHPASMVALAQNKTLVGNSQGVAAEADVIAEWTIGANQPGQKEAKGLVMEAVVSDGSIIAIPIIVRKAVTLTAAGQIQILNDSYAGMFYVIKSITLIARNLASVTQYPTLSVGCNGTWNDIAASQTLNALSNGTNAITLTANAGKSLIEANTNMVLNVATPIIGTGTFKIVVEGYIC
ncbi:hypothetical protein [Acetobacteroides hydrogenigenes]|uniref:Uncharacterized protein n=1 Tax=Acetobacteroides hydrogenigenes TaxID=979970 RepID=A0A4V2RNH0_9BACT|nr:hypothetical protein [Acetobacteroides hydrogenigenes]TCN63670.1 hypothetical protein CLV25_11520 [Acetobacteroides hydrogenigenes]